MLASPRCKTVHAGALAVQGWDSHLWLVGSSTTSCPQAIRLTLMFPARPERRPRGARRCRKID
jgi:hypothetical protein